MDLGNTWNLQQWYDFLADECGLVIGQDFRWSWQNNKMGIYFMDPKVELMVRLKASEHD